MPGFAFGNQSTSALFPPCEFRDGLGSKVLFPPSHLARPLFSSFHFGDTGHLSPVIV